MTPPHTDPTFTRRHRDKLAQDRDFARIAAAVAAAASPCAAVAATPPLPAGNTAGALVSLARGGA